MVSALLYAMYVSGILCLGYVRTRKRADETTKVDTDSFILQLLNVPQECRNRASFMHRLIAIHGLHGTLEDYLRPGLMLHILPLKV